MYGAIFLTVRHDDRRRCWRDWWRRRNRWRHHNLSRRWLDVDCGSRIFRQIGWNQIGCHVKGRNDQIPNEKQRLSSKLHTLSTGDDSESYLFWQLVLRRTAEEQVYVHFHRVITEMEEIDTALSERLKIIITYIFKVQYCVRLIIYTYIIYNPRRGYSRITLIYHTFFIHI